MSRNPFAALADDTSEVGDVPLPKQSKPTQVDAAPPKQGAPKSGKIDNAAPRRHIVGQSKVRELPASDAPAGSQAQFEGERGRDDRGTGFGRGRGGARGRGEGRGRGGPRGGGRGGRGGREERPDRRSATGREDSAKAEHQGWGGDEGKRELEAETEGLTDAAAEAKEGGEAKEANGDDKPAAAAPAEEAAPVEPEDNTQTYEEYLKSRTNANIAGVNQIQSRKANDGADESQWKDGVLVNKPSDNTETFFAITQEQKEKARKQKEKKEKQFLEVEFLPAQRQEREGGRGGRGGARGGRGRGGDSSRGRGEGAGRGRGAPRGAPRGGRGGSSAGANINVDDNKAFPTLA